MCHNSIRCVCLSFDNRGNYSNNKSTLIKARILACYLSDIEQQKDSLKLSLVGEKYFQALLIFISYDYKSIHFVKILQS